MSDKSRIEWTDATWNPVTGCSKVSQGCKNCYAERLWPKLEAAERMREHFEWQRAPKRPFTQVRCHENRLEQPLHWTRPRRIFVNSLSDLFHEDVPDDFIDKVFAVMALASRHTFQVLTKRPERMLRYCRTDDSGDRKYEPDLDGEATRDALIEGQAQAMEATRTGEDPSMWLAVHQPLPNVWLGVSVEDQDTADERIPLLLQTPAAVRFLSCEPLLGPIDIQAAMNAHMPRSTVPVVDVPPFTFLVKGRPIHDHLHWVIAGGESGPRARPTHPDWIRSLRDQCAAAGVAYFFKQLGEWTWHDDPVVPNAEQRVIFADGTTCTKSECDQQDQRDIQKRGARIVHRVGKKAAGRELDGRTHDEYPTLARAE